MQLMRTYRGEYWLVGAPWLFFTLAFVGLLVFVEYKSLCIPQHCRFLVGLLIPVLGIAVVGKVFGASAAVGTAFNTTTDPITFSFASLQHQAHPDERCLPADRSFSFLCKHLSAPLVSTTFHPILHTLPLSMLRASLRSPMS